MSNTTARAAIKDDIAHDIEDALRINLPCDLFDLEDLFRANKPAAYAQIATYSAAQRELLAQAFAALYNARFAADLDADQIDASDVLALWAPHLPSAAPLAYYDHVRVTNPALPDFDRLGRVLLVEASGALFVSLDGDDPRLPSGFAASDLSREPSAPTPESAAAEHTDPATRSTSKEPSTMINASFEENATISISESSTNVPTIRTLASYDPAVVTAVRMALVLQRNNPAFTRALDKVIDLSPAFTFDGRTMTLGSKSEPGKVLSTDGAGCQCRGAGHVACYHRAGFELVFMLEALSDMHGLIAGPPAPAALLAA